MVLTPTFSPRARSNLHDASPRQRTLLVHLCPYPSPTHAVTRPAVSAQVLPFCSRSIDAGAASASGIAHHTRSPANTPGGAICFDVADRMALHAWSHQSSHGYPRLLIEDGHPGGEPDRGSFALAYRPGATWATWGLTRQPGGILVWRCGTGKTFGIYPTMQAALAALPQADDPACG